MSDLKKVAKSQGGEAKKAAPLKKVEKFEGVKEFTVLKDFARFKKGDKVSVHYDRALNWRVKGII